jgi:hypothetical protein
MVKGDDLKMACCHSYPRCACPPTDPIIQAPQKVYRDFYHPQVVPVIQPIEIINRHHSVPVYQHSYSYTVKDEGYGVWGHRREEEEENFTKNIPFLSRLNTIF